MQGSNKNNMGWQERAHDAQRMARSPMGVERMPWRAVAGVLLLAQQWVVGSTEQEPRRACALCPGGPQPLGLVPCALQTLPPGVGSTDTASGSPGSFLNWSDLKTIYILSIFVFLTCHVLFSQSLIGQEIEQNSAMAPRKRGGRGISFIFCCFRNNDHPEITYRLRNDSNFALQTMEPALPMPPVEELDVMFSELVVSLRLPSQG